MFWSRLFQKGQKHLITISLTQNGATLYNRIGLQSKTMTFTNKLNSRIYIGNTYKRYFSTSYKRSRDDNKRNFSMLLYLVSCSVTFGMFLFGCHIDSVLDLLTAIKLSWTFLFICAFL